MKVVNEEKGTFHVMKENGQYHTVEFCCGNDQMPMCSCQDWKKFHIPCKHFFAVFRSQSNWQWDRLPLAYLDGPYISMDKASVCDVTPTHSQTNELPEEAASTTTTNCAISSSQIPVAVCHCN